MPTGTIAKDTNRQLKDAVGSAQAFLTDLYPSLYDVRLEEVETERAGVLAVTLSFLDLNPVAKGTMADLLGATSRRQFKRFEVDVKTKKIRSMKIRLVDH